MLKEILLSPPAAFILVLLVVAFCARLLGGLAAGRRDEPDSSGKAYACGEDFKGNFIQPDYSQFFPFAFFFTILHVVALVVATIPAQGWNSFVIALVYVFAAVTGLLILLRK